MLRMTVMMLTIYAPFAFALEISNLNQEEWCLSCEDYKYCLSEYFEPARVSGEAAYFRSSENDTSVSIYFVKEPVKIEENSGGMIILVGSEKIYDVEVKRYSPNKEKVDFGFNTWIFEIDNCSDSLVSVEGSEESLVENETRQILKRKVVR